MRANFDTNILIDFLAGRSEATREIARYEERSISRIVWMEVLAGVPSQELELPTRHFLDSFDVVELTGSIAEAAVALCRDRSLGLPDAIVLASAREANSVLVTRNTKDFKPSWPDVRVPYRN